MHRPERFNAKARTGGSHKKGKVRKRRRDPSAEGSGHIADANAAVIERKTEAQKEAERRTKMRQEVRKYVWLCELLNNSLFLA